MWWHITLSMSSSKRSCLPICTKKFVILWDPQEACMEDMSFESHQGFHNYTCEGSDLRLAFRLPGVFNIDLVSISFQWKIVFLRIHIVHVSCFLFSLNNIHKELHHFKVFRVTYFSKLCSAITIYWECIVPSEVI